MKHLKIGIVALLALGMVACGGEEDSETANGGDKGGEAPGKSSAELECTYEFQPDKTEVKWIAYKHKAKAKVPGVFDSPRFEGEFEASSADELITGITGYVQPVNIYTNDTARDRKINTFFFGVMAESNEISAKVLELRELENDGENANGECTIQITMNAVSKTFDGTYTVSGDKITVEGDLNILDWNGQKALDSINKACEEKHTGEGDTEAVTWPDVRLIISTTVKKTCVESEQPA